MRVVASLKHTLNTLFVGKACKSGQVSVVKRDHSERSSRKPGCLFSTLQVPAHERDDQWQRSTKGIERQDSSACAVADADRGPDDQAEAEVDRGGPTLGAEPVTPRHGQASWANLRRSLKRAGQARFCGREEPLVSKRFSEHSSRVSRSQPHHIDA